MGTKYLPERTNALHRIVHKNQPFQVTAVVTDNLGKRLDLSNEVLEWKVSGPATHWTTAMTGTVAITDAPNGEVTLSMGENQFNTRGVWRHTLFNAEGQALMEGVIYVKEV